MDCRMDMDKEQAQVSEDELNQTGTLADEALDSVAGGMAPIKEREGFF